MGRAFSCGPVGRPHYDGPVKLREWGSASRPRAAVWLADNSVRVVLFITGVLLVLGAIYVVPDREPLSSTLTAAGTALIAFGALLPYIEGPFAFGPFRGKKAVPPIATRDVPPTTASENLVVLGDVPEASAAADAPVPTGVIAGKEGENDA